MEKNSLINLPQELHYEIYSYLTPQELATAFLLSKYSFMVANKKSLWLTHLKKLGLAKKIQHHLFCAQPLGDEQYKIVYWHFNNLLAYKRGEGNSIDIEAIKLQQVIGCMTDVTYIETYLATAPLVEQNFVKSQLVIEAAQAGNFYLVHYLLEHQKVIPTRDLIDITIYYGNLAMLKTLLEAYELKPYASAFYKAIIYEHLAMVKYFVEEYLEDKFYPISELDKVQAILALKNVALIDYLIAHGVLAFQYEMEAIFGWQDDRTSLYQLKHQGLNVDRWQLMNAAKQGAIHLVKYLITQCHLAPTKTLLDQSIHHLPVVQYLVEQAKITPDGETLRHAVNGGNTQVVEYLITYHELMPSQEELYLAIKFGRLNMVQFLLEQGGLVPTQVILDEAIKYNHGTMVCYLIEQQNLRPSLEIFALMEAGPMKEYLSKQLELFNDLNETNKTTFRLRL